jgi:hypothetical protein
MPREPQFVTPEIVDDDQDALDEASSEVSPVVVDAIGKALKAHYRAIAEIPLPDRFLVLLAELEAKEGRHDA